MKTIRPALISILLCGPLAVHPARSQPGAPPWLAPERTAPEAEAAVLAQWTFQPDAPDGAPYAYTFRGESRISGDSRSGFGLEGFNPGEDRARAGGAIVPNAPGLTPAGAFTLEAWIRPKPEFFAWPHPGFLIDKKFFPSPSTHPNANFDYLLMLQPSGGRHRLLVSLGYGTDSALYESGEIVLPPEAWSHVAFIYDARGRGRFFLNGEFVGQTLHEGRGPVAAGPHPLAIGDRVGRNHGPFLGHIGFRTGSASCVPKPHIEGE